MRCNKEDALVSGGEAVRDGACLDAWQRCVALPRCELVELDPEWRWATLKVSKQAPYLVLTIDLAQGLLTNYSTHHTSLKVGPSTRASPPSRMTLAQRLHALRSGGPQVSAAAAGYP